MCSRHAPDFLVLGPESHSRVSGRLGVVVKHVQNPKSFRDRAVTPYVQVTALSPRDSARPPLRRAGLIISTLQIKTQKCNVVLKAIGVGQESSCPVPVKGIKSHKRGMCHSVSRAGIAS